MPSPRARPRARKPVPRRVRKQARPKRPTYRIQYTPALLAELRHAFEETPLSLQAIATAHGFSRRTLATKAEAEGWVRYQRPALDLSPAVKLDARLAATEKEAAEIVSSGTRATPTPEPPPPLAAPMAGGERALTPGGETAPPADSNFAARFRRVAADALVSAERLIANLESARRQMQETGQYAQAAQLGRELNSITNSLYRIKRLHGGATDGVQIDDDVPADLDALRDALARRIEIIVAEWRNAEAHGPVGAAAPASALD